MRHKCATYKRRVTFKHSIHTNIVTITAIHAPYELKYYLHIYAEKHAHTRTHADYLCQKYITLIDFTIFRFMTAIFRFA